MTKTGLEQQEVVDKPKNKDKIGENASFTFLDDFTKNVLEQELTNEEIANRILKTELAFSKMGINSKEVIKTLSETIWTVTELKTIEGEGIKDTTKEMAANNIHYIPDGYVANAKKIVKDFGIAA